MELFRRWVSWALFMLFVCLKKHIFLPWWLWHTTWWELTETLLSSTRDPLWYIDTFGPHVMCWNFCSSIQKRSPRSQCETHAKLADLQPRWLTWFNLNELRHCFLQTWERYTWRLSLQVDDLSRLVFFFKIHITSATIHQTFIKQPDMPQNWYCDAVIMQWLGALKHSDFYVWSVITGSISLRGVNSSTNITPNSYGHN